LFFSLCFTPFFLFLGFRPLKPPLFFFDSMGTFFLFFPLSRKPFFVGTSSFSPLPRFLPIDFCENFFPLTRSFSPTMVSLLVSLCDFFLADLLVSSSLSFFFLGDFYLAFFFPFLCFFFFTLGGFNRRCCIGRCFFPPPCDRQRVDPFLPLILGRRGDWT